MPLAFIAALAGIHATHSGKSLKALEIEQASVSQFISAIWDNKGTGVCFLPLPVYKPAAESQNRKNKHVHSSGLLRNRSSDPVPQNTLIILYLAAPKSPGTLQPQDPAFTSQAWRPARKPREALAAAAEAAALRLSKHGSCGIRVCRDAVMFWGLGFGVKGMCKA